MKRHPEIPDYTAEDWVADLVALSKRFRSSGSFDPQSIARYTREKYPDRLDADRRAWFLHQAYGFMGVNMAALDEARLAVEGEKSSVADKFVMLALFGFFFEIEWKSVPPPMPTVKQVLDAVKKLRAQE